MHNSDKPLQKKKYLVFGDLCVDIFMGVDKYPDIGGDGNASELRRQIGGSATNTAIALAHLGNCPSLVTHIGSDDQSKVVRDDLVKEGVNVKYMVVEKEVDTGLTLLIVTPDGERTMFTYRGANALLQPDEINPALFNDISMIHISGYALLKPPQSDAVLKAIEIASRRNIGVSLDLGVDPAYKVKSTILSILPKIKLLVLGQGEAEALSGKSGIDPAIDFLINCGVDTIAMKLGKQGCLIATKDSRDIIDGFNVDVVDTTGAGDAFSAGMISGISNGWKYPLAGLLANAMGAIAVTHWGAGKLMPGKNEVLEFLRTNMSAKNQTNSLEIMHNLGFID